MLCCDMSQAYLYFNVCTLYITCTQAVCTHCLCVCLSVSDIVYVSLINAEINLMFV